MSDDLTPFAVLGLYRRGNPDVIFAADEADARRQFHDRYPGWAGTILKVFEAPEPESEVDDES